MPVVVVVHYTRVFSAVNCEFATLTKGSRCIHPGCGVKLPCDFATAPVVVCSGRVGLGDALAAALSSIGVTKERYSEVKEMFGLPPSCGCDERREWLNRVGEWWNNAVTD
jgi:hypothetical protein